MQKPKFSRRPRSRKLIRKETAQTTLLLAGFLLSIGLSACSPVETWRNLTGASKDEPNPKTTPNTRNLQAGAQTPYPNLATVPPPPTQGLTEAEIEKLTQSLVADRTNARYTAEALGTPAYRPVPPPPPKLAQPPISKASPPGPAPQAPPQPQPSAPPIESSLTMPRIGSLPEPEAGRPAPPPPHLPPAPKPVSEALAMAPIKPPPEEPVRLPAPGVRPAAPQPPPEPPAQVLPALAPKPPIAAPAPKSKPIRLASITFPLGVTTLNPAVKAKMAAVAAQFREHPGTLRVVTYASEGQGTLAALNSFSAALAQGQSVAAALKDAGIPANKIKVEASPTHLPFGLSRVEILLIPS